MYKAAVMGEYDSIYGFASVGLETIPVSEAKEAEEKLRELADAQYAIVYITESMAEKIEKTIARYKEAMLPAIILIPGVFGNTGRGVENVKKSVEQAVGSDILFGNNK